MTEWEKAQAVWCGTPKELLHQILGGIKENLVVTAPFYCDYGSNISVGDNFYTNHNCTILDGAKVELGDNVFIAPNCVFSTAGHAIDSGQRSAGLEIARLLWTCVIG